jgi:hypothetical protein
VCVEDFLRDIKKSIQTRPKINNDPRPGGHAELAEVGVLRQVCRKERDRA